MKKFLPVFTVVVATCSLLFLTPTAKAVSPDTASGWSKVWIQAYAPSNGDGCMDPNADVRLSPIISWTCDSITNWWWGRILNYDGGAHQWGDNGAKLEFVDQTKTWAIGFSGGLFKLETPNAGSTYLYVDSVPSTSGYGAYYESSLTYFASPSGAGDDLGVNTGSPTVPNPDGWTVCFSYTRC